MSASKEREITLSLPEHTTLLITLDNGVVFRVTYGGSEGNCIVIHAEMPDQLGRQDEIYSLGYTPPDASALVADLTAGSSVLQGLSFTPLDEFHSRNRVTRATACPPASFLDAAQGHVEQAEEAPAPAAPAPRAMLDAPRDGTPVVLFEATNPPREIEGRWQSSFGRQGWEATPTLNGLYRDESFLGWRPI